MRDTGNDIRCEDIRYTTPYQKPIATVGYFERRSEEENSITRECVCVWVR